MTVGASLSQWPEKTSGLICDEKGLNLILKELLRPKSWQIMNATDTVEELVELRVQNKIGCFIVVDSPTMPATETLRVLFKNPRSRLTPTLVLCSSPNSTDLMIYERIFNVTPTAKPLTASNFNIAFSQMLTLWEQPPMAALRKLATLPDGENHHQKIAILERLKNSPTAMPIAISTIAQLLTSNGMFKEAEAKLIEQCKLHIKNPAILAICAWFYLSNRMPTQAVRFLEKLKTVAPTSTLLNLDLAAGYIGSGEIASALQVIFEWGRRNPGYPQLENTLTKLLLADGRADAFDRFGITKHTLQRHLQEWELLENGQVNSATTKPKEQNAS